VKLCSYQLCGKNQYGVMTDGGIIDLTRRIERNYPTLVSLIRGQAIANPQVFHGSKITLLAYNKCENLS